jgi:Protein of unknown function (DUF2721)
MEALQSAVTVLTAMITPAVLISSCAALILSTSLRLGRVADRVRSLSDKLEAITHGETKPEHYRERLRTIFFQLDKLTSRARILQRSIVVFYTALGTFVATSIAIVVVAVSGSQFAWLPVAFGFGGACLLFYGSVTLIYEARLSLQTINTEMNFIWHLAEFHAPAELKEHKVRGT